MFFGFFALIKVLKKKCTIPSSSLPPFQKYDVLSSYSIYILLYYKSILFLFEIERYDQKQKTGYNSRHSHTVTPFLPSSFKNHRFSSFFTFFFVAWHSYPYTKNTHTILIFTLILFYNYRTFPFAFFTTQITHVIGLRKFLWFFY